MTPVIFVFLALPAAHHRRALPVSPVGLSAMNRLAPTFMASLIMGAWFYMTAVGNFVAGKIGEATGGHDGEMTKESTLAIYTQDRLDHDRRRRDRAGAVAVREALDAPRHAARRPRPGRRSRAGRAAGAGMPPRAARPRPDAPAGGFARLAAALAVGCSHRVRAEGKAASPARSGSTEDPYPSTYQPYRRAPTVIRGATILDGEGGRIDNGSIAAGRRQGPGGRRRDYRRSRGRDR